MLCVSLVLLQIWLVHCCNSGVELSSNNLLCKKRLAYPCDANNDEVEGCCCENGYQWNATGYCEECSFSINWGCTAAMVVASGAGIAAAPALLALAGFTSAGISAGSLAALWQANMAGIASGSLFSTLQSISMAGLGWGGTVSVGGTVGA
ncbi:unnamed protein product [Durusdinium trenchii]|uniref:Uncharacterized protein n=1 Tax=Durusdinium trenchii TaxID=1381693 RepID=A0ABP0MC80_9DINO